MTIQDKQKEVEHGLRYTVLFSNRPNKKMNLLERMAYYKVPGVSIAVINNNKIEWAKAYGLSDNEIEEALTTHHLFQVGSDCNRE